MTTKVDLQHLGLTVCLLCSFKGVLGLPLLLAALFNVLWVRPE